MCFLIDRIVLTFTEDGAESRHGTDPSKEIILGINKVAEFRMGFSPFELKFAFQM